MALIEVAMLANASARITDRFEGITYCPSDLVLDGVQPYYRTRCFQSCSGKSSVPAIWRSWQMCKSTRTISLSIISRRLRKKDFRSLLPHSYLPRRTEARRMKLVSMQGGEGGHMGHLQPKVHTGDESTIYPLRVVR
jgi:hypothetical protein